MGETGQTGGEPGQPQLTPWAEGIFPDLHYTTAGNIAINAGPGRQPRLVASWSAPFGGRSLLATERGLGWGRESAVPTADSLLPQATDPQLAHTAEYQSQKFQSNKINNIPPCEPRNL